MAKKTKQRLKKIITCRPAVFLAHEHPYLAMLSNKRWPSTGVDLSVQFLDSPDQATRSKILAFANRWANNGAVAIRFRETSQQGDVRIARNPGDGYWSYIGTDLRNVPAASPTMNLEGFTSATPDSEYARVVPHEFGHSCGFPHEHQRADIVKLLDPGKTITYFQQTYGWPPAMTQQQVLTPLSESSLFQGSSVADVQSIMAYQFPGACTKSGQPIPGGVDIDATDYATAAKFYPGAVVPPPPPSSTLGAVRVHPNTGIIEAIGPWTFHQVTK